MNFSFFYLLTEYDTGSQNDDWRQKKKKKYGIELPLGKETKSK